MSRKSIPLLLATVLVICAGARMARAGPETKDYVIDAYELTIETQPDSADVRVQMDITYLIRSGTKSTGFKYIGDHEAEQLTGRDGEGNAMATWVDHQRETKINWSFNPAGRGRKRIIVSFIIRGALASYSEANRFEANWAGIFRVPVNRAVYRLVLPDEAKHIVRTTPPNFTITTRQGRRSVEITQAPLTEVAFDVQFSPIIVGNQSMSRSSAAGASDFPWGLLGGVPITIILIAIGVVVIIFLIAKANRAKGSDGWWSSVSSCAGGSSCGGGGCGGGGCGGGCGG